MARGRKRAASRDHILFEQSVVRKENGEITTGSLWKCKYCNGEEDGGVRKTVTFPASRFDVHLTVQCSRTPDEVKSQILARSLSQALIGPRIPAAGNSYVAFLQKSVHAAPSAHASNLVSAAETAPVSVLESARDVAEAEVAKRRRVLKSGEYLSPEKFEQLGASNIPAGGNVPSCDGQADFVADAAVQLFSALGLPLSYALQPSFREFCGAFNKGVVQFMPKNVDDLYKSSLGRVYEKSRRSAESDQPNRQGSFCSLQLEVFREGDELFFNVFESTYDKRSFLETASVGVVGGNPDLSIAQAVDTQLGGAGLADYETMLPLTMQERYGGVVSNVFRSHPGVLPMLSKRYHRLFFLGCALEALFDMIRGIFGMSEIVLLLANAKFVDELMRSRPELHNLIVEPRRRTNTSFRTGWDGVQTLTRALARHKEYMDILASPEWQALKAVSNGTPGIWEDVMRCEKWLQDPKSLRALLDCKMLLTPFVGAVDHVEAHGCWSSWVFPLFTSLVEDCREWAAKDTDASSLSVATRAGVLASVASTWSDSLQTDGHLFAWLMDPYTSPLPEALPEGSRDVVRGVLRRALADSIDVAGQVSTGLDELEGVLLREGEWGKVTSEVQDSLAAACAAAEHGGGTIPGTTGTAEDAAAREGPRASRTEATLRRMRAAGNGGRKWRAYGCKQYAVLGSAAVRALSLPGCCPRVLAARGGGTPELLGGSVAAHLADDTARKLLHLHVNGRLADAAPARAGAAELFAEAAAFAAK